MTRVALRCALAPANSLLGHTELRTHHLHSDRCSTAESSYPYTREGPAVNDNSPLLSQAMKLGLVTLLVGALLLNVVSGPGHVALAQTAPPMTDGLLRDRAALVALRNSVTTNGFGRSRVKSSWMKRLNPCHPQPWAHVQCVNYRVVSVNWAGMGIKASSLPQQLATMDQLVTLDLSGNEIVGTLPDTWGRRLSFVRLKTLNLQNNNLYGTLPGWNAKGAWPRLQTLNLQGNNFHGRLPETWAGSALPLRRLVTLDLSNNYLGKDGGIDSTSYLSLPDNSSNWGSAAQVANPFAALQTLDLSENYFAGSLPNWGKQYAFTSLRTLDLRYNQLTGTIRVGWGAPGAFPRLRNLYLSGNSLGDTSAPGGLPSEWTRMTVPRSFPQLESLMLYPGNDLVCAWLNGNTQYNAEYRVTDDTLVEYGAAKDGGPWLCPDPDPDNPPASASLSLPATTLQMDWEGPDAATKGYMCGFRTSLRKNGVEVYTYDWQVRPAQSTGLTVNAAWDPIRYSADSGYTPGTGTYVLLVSTLNCNQYIYSSRSSSELIV